MASHERTLNIKGNIFSAGMRCLQFISSHSRPQSLRSFWPVVGIESSGRTRFSEHAQSIRFALSTNQICWI